MASFNLSNLADRLSQVISQNPNISTVFGKNDRAVRELFSSLSNGETILGKILSVSEDSFQISTLDNLIINAKSEGKIDLSPGSNVLFEVNKFTDNKVSLRPLYQNTNYEETAKTALNQAGIEITPRSLELVARSMEYGNPIDRNSLLIAYKDVLSFPDTPVKFLVDLKQMNLEVNKTNVQQFENYMNAKNLISDSFEELSGGFIKDLTEAFTVTDSMGDTVLSNGISLKNYENTVNLMDDFINISKELSSDKTTLFDYSQTEIEALVDKLNESGIKVENTDNLIVRGDSQEIIQDIPVKASVVMEAILKDIKSSVTAPFEMEQVINENVDINTDSQNVTEDKANTVNKTDSAVVNDKDVMDIIAKHPDFKKFIKDDAVKEVISRAISSAWSVNIDDVDKKAIKDLYNKLYKETQAFTEILEVSSSKNTHVSQMVDNLTKNLDFMDQINHYLPYVQVPFSDKDGVHSGELYVYRNKKRLTDNDSELSVFLHLDMDNLGPVDVYVKLKYNQVSTNFKLADEDALNLINNNIEFLNKRLDDKGYSLKCEFTLDDRSKAPIQEMIFNTENHLIISRNSFDARV